MKTPFLLLPLLGSLAHAASLVVYLPLDGDTAAGGGTLVSGTVIGTNGTPENNFTTGKFGQAAFFNNANGNTTAIDDWAISLGNLDAMYAGDFSVSLWVRWTGTANASVDAAIMGNSNWHSGANTGWAITSFNSGREGKLKTDTGARQNESIAWKDGSWNLITLVVDNTENLGFWYLNGALLNPAGDDFGGGTFSAGLDTLIGGSGNGPWSARTTEIDDVAIWSGQLTGDEVSILWNDGAGNLATAVPEPSGALLGGLGTLLLLRRTRRPRHGF